MQTNLIIPKIGQYWEGEGGHYAGLFTPQDGSEARHLIVDLSHIIIASWGEYGQDIPGAESKFDGRANTLAILAADPDNKAALHVSSLEVDGHKDFFWPAQLELMQVYINLGARIADVLKDSWVHSSTQCAAGGAWGQFFGDGNVDTWTKDYKASVLALRSISASVL